MSLEVDVQTARVFLAALDFDNRVDAPHAFQTFPDEKAPTQQQTWDLTKGGAKHPEMTGPFESVLPLILDLHRKGACPHVSINETDGSGGRAAENIVALRTCCVDFDHGEMYEKDGYTVPQTGIAVGPEPSMVVRTPRGVHWYWLLHRFDGEDFGEYCTRWRATQKAIAKQYKGDENVCSPAATMRIPGFVHQKRAPLNDALYRALLLELRDTIQRGESTVVLGSPAANQIVRDQYVARGGEFAQSQLVRLEKCDPQIRYELGHLVRGLGLKISQRPTIIAPKLDTHDHQSRVKRCRALLDRVPPAIESRYGGDGKAYSHTQGVCGIGGDYGLSPEEFFPLLLSWNARCVPPWDEGELWTKLQRCHVARTEPFGCMLDQESEGYRRHREEWQRQIREHEDGAWKAALESADKEAGPKPTLVTRDGAKPPDPFFDGLPSGEGGKGGDGDDDHGNVVFLHRGDGGEPRSFDESGAPHLWRLDTASVECKGPDQITVTPMGNMQRLCDRYGHVLRYVKTFDRWYIWDGKRWRPDTDAEEINVRAPVLRGTKVDDYVKASGSDPFDSGDYILELAKRVARSMHALTKAIQIPERDDDGKIKRAPGGIPLIDKDATDDAKMVWRKHCLNSERLGALRDMCILSRTDRDIARPPSYFDPYNHLINTQSGPLDLRTGIYYPHHPGFRQSKIVRISPKKSGCPVWTKFLGRVLGENDDLIRFVQRAVGYSLTGETREQVLFLLYGTGKNGKSTFLNVLHGLAGEYAQHAEFSTFIERQSDVVRNDLARLHKSRLVTAVEPQASGYLDESVIKQVTGQDVVTARFLYHEHFEYVPRFKIWLASNHKPMIRGNDEGIWRRILMIPFTVRITEEEKDPTLPTKLAAEAPAIFQWAADGAKLWYEEGLNAPDIVREATQAYRDEMDSIGLFMTMRCVLATNVRAMATSLYRHYHTWAEAVGERPLSQKKFGMRLDERGIAKRRTNKGYEYQGIAIRDDEAIEQTSDRRLIPD